MGIYSARAVYVIFFFFQAEDGIRDVAVTGVQTCALPILFALAVATADSALANRAGSDSIRVRQLASIVKARALVNRGQFAAAAAAVARSEERRGGEEGRSRWAPYH